MSEIQSQPTFDNLPQFVAEILSKTEENHRLLRLLLEKDPVVQQEPIKWFDLDELVIYDPEKRSKYSFYAYVKRREIPYHKRGKKLIFMKSEIDAWLKEGRRQSKQECKKELSEYMTKKEG